MLTEVHPLPLIQKFCLSPIDMYLTSIQEINSHAWQISAGLQATHTSSTARFHLARQQQFSRVPPCTRLPQGELCLSSLSLLNSFSHVSFLFVSPTHACSFIRAVPHIMHCRVKVLGNRIQTWTDAILLFSDGSQTAQKIRCVAVN